MTDVLAELAWLAGVFDIRRNQTQDFAEVERRLYDALNDAHLRKVEDLLEDAVKALKGVTLGDDDLRAAIESAATRRLGSEFALRAVPAIMRASAASVKAGAAAAGKPIGPTWRLTDQRAAEWLASDSIYWSLKSPASLLFSRPKPDGTSEQLPLGRWISDTVLDARRSGLGAQAIGDQLKTELEEHVGPRSSNYWRGVASTAITRGASLGALSAFERAGVLTSEWTSVLDERTSDVCRALDGTIIPTGDISALRQRAMTADPTDKETFKEAWPWPKLDEVTSAKAGGGRPSNVAAPPAHFHCRCTLTPVDFGPVDEAPLPALPVPPPPTRLPPVYDSRGRPLDDYDPRHPALYAPPEQQKPGEMHILTRIREDGFGDPVVIQAPGTPEHGMRFSHWPTSEPANKKHVWVPMPGTIGGHWEAPAGISGKGAPAGAITGSWFSKWRRPIARSSNTTSWGTGFGAGVEASIAPMRLSPQKARRWYEQVAGIFQNLVTDEMAKVKGHLSAERESVGRHDYFGDDAIHWRVLRRLVASSGGSASTDFRAGVVITAPDPLGNIAEGLDLFGEMLSKNAWVGYQLAGKQPRIFRDPAWDRAYYNEMKGVNAGDLRPPLTFVHEHGHWLEDKAPQLLHAATQWRNGRATSKTARQIPGYGPDEKGLPGPWKNDYDAKVYRGPRGAELASEVTSMGLQYLADPNQARELLRDHPEHFGLALATMLGRLKR